MDTHREDTLAEWLQRRGMGMLSFQELTSLVWQAAQALQSIHDRRLVYQNVGPTCFLVREGWEHAGLPTLQLAAGGSPVAVDRLPGMDTSLTNAPIYRAPEQWQGMTVLATDQYALAVLVYQLLTGRAPFQGTWEQVKEQHLSLPPEPPSRLNTRIPPATDKVILRALAKKPQDRYPSVSAFAGAFEQALLPSLAPTLQQRPPVPTFPPRYQQTAQPVPGLPSAFKELAFLGIAFVLVVSGIGFGLFSIARNNQAAATSMVASAFIDPLNKNVDGRWLDNAGKGCAFQDGPYHTLVPNDASSICLLPKLRFSNMAIQADVSLIAGSEVGLVFRVHEQSGKIDLYDFEIKNQEGFFFRQVTGYGSSDQKITVLASGSPPGVINPKHQKNTLLVSANGSNFRLYINGTPVAAVQDKESSFNTGLIGLVVEAFPPETHGDASFSNLAVLPL